MIHDKIVSVVIPTKNRMEELRICLLSVLKQSIKPEVIVLDDASTDGTADMMVKEFSRVKFVGSEKSIGPIVQRNFGTKLASSPIVVFIDDDTEFKDTKTIEQILEYFDHPRVAVVTIPYINIYLCNKIYQRSPNKEGFYIIHTFTGVGFAVRKDIFLDQKGFRDILFMDAEESDISIRMLDDGYVVRLGYSVPISHFLSPKRENAFRFNIRVRNHIILPWLNTPTCILPFHIIATVINNLIQGLHSDKLLQTLQSLLKGFRFILSEWSSRNPVSLNTYIIYRLLRRKIYTNFFDIEDNLNPLYMKN